MSFASHSGVVAQTPFLLFEPTMTVARVAGRRYRAGNAGHVREIDYRNASLRSTCFSAGQRIAGANSVAHNPKVHFQSCLFSVFSREDSVFFCPSCQGLLATNLSQFIRGPITSSKQHDRSCNQVLREPTSICISFSIPASADPSATEPARSKSKDAGPSYLHLACKPSPAAVDSVEKPRKGECYPAS